MKKETKKLIADAVRGFRLPRYAEIPDIGLYLEQTTKYINGFLEPLGGMMVTASMISNYVKKDLVPNPVKKQYFAEQIAYLFFVVIAKNILSMEDIALLIDMQRSSYSTPVAYDYMCEELENMVFYAFGVTDKLEELGQTVSDEKDLLRGLVFSVADMAYMHACFEAVRRERENGNEEDG